MRPISPDSSLATCCQARRGNRQDGAIQLPTCLLLRYAMGQRDRFDVRKANGRIASLGARESAVQLCANVVCQALSEVTRQDSTRMTVCGHAMPHCPAVNSAGRGHLLSYSVVNVFAHLDL